MGVTPGLDTPRWDSEGWVPVRVANDGSGTVDWAYLQGMPFDDPFFDQTVERAFRNPFRLLVRRRSSLEEVAGLTRRRARDPDGLILHMSRCGSTMLASALRAGADAQVLSEPGPVDTVIATTEDPGVAAVRLRHLLRGMAPDRPGTPYLVKLDAWTTLDLPVVRAAFPDVPWVFLHRNPGEVLVSLQGRRGFHVIPGALPASRTGLAQVDVARMGLDEYAAAVLGRIMTVAAEHARLAGDRALVLDYTDLPDPGVELAAQHLGLALDDAARRRIDAVIQLDAKNPSLPWSPDTERKRQAVTPALREVAQRRTAAAHQELRHLERLHR